MTSGAAWECPECRDRLAATAESQDAARGALIILVRRHLDDVHAGAEGIANAAAQAGGWLQAAGHLVELWGGPHDGSTVWVPPGDLPRTIGLQRTPDGVLVPVRSATARLLPGVDTYVLGVDGTGTTAADRYVWTP